MKRDIGTRNIGAREVAAASGERKVQAMGVALRDYIRRNCKEGDALIPVRQLVKRFGVSIHTVCGALQQMKLAGTDNLRQFGTKR